MSRISGKVYEVSSGKPIAGANVVLSTTDVLHPIEADITDANGVYTIDNPATDDANAQLFISADNYGDAAVDTKWGDVGLYRTNFISSVPKWVWVVVAVLALVIIIYGFKKLNSK